jgi:hypothetical protein
MTDSLDIVRGVRVDRRSPRDFGVAGSVLNGPRMAAAISDADVDSVTDRWPREPDCGTARRFRVEAVVPSFLFELVETSVEVDTTDRTLLPALLAPSEI